MIDISYFAVLAVGTSGLVAMYKEVVIPIVVGSKISQEGEYVLQASVCSNDSCDYTHDCACSALIESNLKGYKPIYPYYQRIQQSHQAD
jgi:hypothetical protein